MQEWPPQDETNNSDELEKEDIPEELNNREEYMIKKYNEIVGSDMPLSKIAYKSLGGGTGIINKLVKKGFDNEELSNEFLSVSRSGPNPDAAQTQPEDVLEIPEIKFDFDHLNLEAIKGKIAEKHSLFVRYKNLKRVIIEETGSEKVRRADILNRLKESFEDPRYKNGFIGTDYTDYLNFMSILHSEINYDSYEDSDDWKNEKSEEIDLTKVGATSMESEIKQDPMLADYYNWAKKKLIEETGQDTVNRRLIISELAKTLDDTENFRTTSEAMAAHRLREIFYKEVEKEHLLNI